MKRSSSYKTKQIRVVILSDLITYTMKEDGAHLVALVSIMATLSGALASDVDYDTNPRSICDPSKSNKTIHDFTFPSVYQNDTIDMSLFRGKVVMVVNTASF